MEIEIEIIITLWQNEGPDYIMTLQIGARDTREVNEFFSIYLILPAAVGHGVYSVSNKNETQKQKNNVSGEQNAAGT
jgi:hypothetical protein